MAGSSVIPASLRRYLTNGCGYKQGWVQTDYEYETDRFVDLAAFAHEPFDARSACIAAIDCKSKDPRTEVLGCRSFGAPVVFACLGDRLQVWKPGQDRAELKEPGIRPKEIPEFFRRHKADLSPQRVYEAKTLGRIPGSGRQLEFVDVGLLPFVEGQIGATLTDHVEEAVISLKKLFVPGQPTATEAQWIVKSVFRLLAAKILHDKDVPKFKKLPQNDLKALLERVHKHCGSHESVEIVNRKQAEVLEEIRGIFFDLSSLRNLTTEALADVYERALVTERTRRLLGTHSTPAYLVDYIVWQLAPWIAKIDPAELRVFEPACGHAPFLVAAMRLIRNLDLVPKGENASEFFRRELHGIENDFFALEIARLSLTVADVPNPNGWEGLEPGDMFKGDRLERQTRQCRILLSNPPFEGAQAMRLVQDTLPHLPDGGVFGLVLPTGQLLTRDKRKKQVFELRKWIVENCQLDEVCLFPDSHFHFADQEFAIVLGRRLTRKRTPGTRVRCRRVREEDAGAFEERYGFTTDRKILQKCFLEDPYTLLWVAEWDDEVWSWLRAGATLDSIAIVRQGLFYKGRTCLPKKTKTIEECTFPGAVKGYAHIRGDWGIHSHPPLYFLNLDLAVIDRRVGGATPSGPQVLVNYAPATRGIWRLKPFVDEVGRPFTNRLSTVRPLSSNTPLEYLWAICSSPVANAYMYTHALKRDVIVGLLGKIPIPCTDPSGIRRVTEVVRNYLDAARKWDTRKNAAQSESMPLWDGALGYNASPEPLHELLRRVDSEVLRLYDLPARAERILLSQFTGKVRPGVPGEFKGYHRERGDACVPLYAYLSDAYQRFLKGAPTEVSDDVRRRYDALIDKKLATVGSDAEGGTYLRGIDGLSPEEQDELYQLEAEMDGADYAEHPPDDAWLRESEAKRRESNERMDRIAEDLLDSGHPGGRERAAHT